MAGGRLSQLTKENRRAIARALANGLPYKFAAEIAGVDISTLFRWLRIGRRSTEDCPERQFYHEVKKARGKGVEARLKRITKAATKGAWQADAWVLERTHPDHFSASRGEVVALRKEIRQLLERLERAEGASRRSTGSQNGQPSDWGVGGQPAGVDD